MMRLFAFLMTTLIGHRRRSSKTSRPWGAVALLTLMTSLTLQAANAQSTPQSKPAPPANETAKPATAESLDPAAADSRTPALNIAKRLVELDDEIEKQEIALRKFRRSIRGLTENQLSVEQKNELDTRTSDLRSLKAAFEQIALGGLDTGPLQPEQPKSYDWQAELLDVMRPVLASLKDLTDKPRRVENTRQRINQLERQISVTRDALASLQELGGTVTDKDVRAELDAMTTKWSQRQLEFSSQRDVAQIQLTSMLDETRSNWEIVREAGIDFFEGRGLTLIIAVAAAISVWLLIRVLLSLLRRIRRLGDKAGKTRKARLRRDRALKYLSRFFTGLLMAIAVLATFYVRSDVFLLALSILVIVGLGLGLRHILPRFYAEIRLLLDFGAVRDSERLLYEGVPMQVKEMSTFAILANPLLKGFVRLPLNELTERNSHPIANDPWFPTHQHDYVMFEDGSFAQVIEQSVDTVVLRQLGSVRHMQTAEFFAAALTNLSQDGFLVPVTFGIGYRHQAISLTEVPDKIRLAVEQAVQAADWGEHCTGVIVDFKEAAASSLNYLVLLKMTGDAASSYYSIGRAVQQTLVALCNEQDWEIPFAQLTVHQADG
ncbi:MAG: hypothetical protein AB8C46_09345 [Burkholderiaceae bacterium]